MKISDVSVPEIYKDSADFRFFLKWFEYCLTNIHYDTENGENLYDPLKCPSHLLWMLADTMGFKYDDRLPASFNRLVLVYFMSMIRNRGSKDGVTLAAEVNLKQFDIELVAGLGYENKDGEFVEPKDILFNRLEDTSIPVNAAYVTPHTAEGYIDVVYFSDRNPIDACIEYVRPLGMYLFQYAGVRFDGRTKISIDPSLANIDDLSLSIGPTHVGHYSREDYARLQKVTASEVSNREVETSYSSYSAVDLHEWKLEPTDHPRRRVWYRNSEYEGHDPNEPIQGPDRSPDENINPGYRALYSLQLCNNEHIVKSLIPKKPGVSVDRDPIFGLGWQPQDVEYQPRYRNGLPSVDDEWLNGRSRAWNLRYDKTADQNQPQYITNRVDPSIISGSTFKIYSDKNARITMSPVDSYDSLDIQTLDMDRSPDIMNPRPAINPVMQVVGDANSESDDNSVYLLAGDVRDDQYVPLTHVTTLEGNGFKIVKVTYDDSKPNDNKFEILPEVPTN